MPLKISDGLNTGRTAPEPAPSGDAASPTDSGRLETAPPLGQPELPRPDIDSTGRARVSDDLLDELTRWPSRDRMGIFRKWHQGALSIVHLNVLSLLEAEGPLSMSRLAELLDVSVASCTGIVDRMERRGFVIRRHATDDRRLVLVDLTDRGAGVFRDIEAHRRERLSRVLAELSQPELAGFLTGLRAVRAARQRLQDAAQEAGWDDASRPGGLPAAPGDDRPVTAPTPAEELPR